MVSRLIAPLTRGSVSHCRRFCTQQISQTLLNPKVCVGPDDERVQELILRMTGMDFDKVFAPRREPLSLPKYKLMTLEELQKAHLEAKSQAAELVRMPPILPERSPRGEVIETDDRLSNYTEHRMIFTDTTQHKDNKERRIVVRETDGTLREATWDERDRMCQVFFPWLGRQMWIPPVLTPDGIGTALKSNYHVNVLDRVCLQCEPDSEDYIRVHRTVYEHVEKNRLYDLLRSTKYFGSMVWYLVKEKTISRLLEDMFKRNLYSDAADLVSLYLLVCPDIEVTEKRINTDIARIHFVKAFCEHQGMRDMLTLLTSIEHDLTDSVQEDSEAHIM